MKENKGEQPEQEIPVGEKEKKEYCPICGSESITYNDFFGIQCDKCKQLIIPITP